MVDFIQSLAGVIVGAAVAIVTEVIRGNRSDKNKLLKIEAAKQAAAREFQRSTALEVQVLLAKWQQAAVKTLILANETESSRENFSKFIRKYWQSLSKFEFRLDYQIQRLADSKLRQVLERHLESHRKVIRQLEDRTTGPSDAPLDSANPEVIAFLDYGQMCVEMVGRYLRSLDVRSENTPL